MPYYSPALPLTRDSINGYKLTETITDVVKQNFKMLILTVPGERIMIPDFGVGLYQFLFENFSDRLEEKIIAKIHQQVNKYMSFLTVTDIVIEPGKTEYGEAIANTLFIRIEYFLDSLSDSDVLEISVSA